MIFEEKTLKSEYVFKGKLIKVRKDTVTTVNGQSTREIVEHAGGSVIAALKENGNLLMIRQFRKPVEDVVFEVPAGKIDPGEEPVDAALRELKEETGYSAKTIEFLTKTYPSVGFSKEILYIYLCTGLTPGKTDFDENEAIDLEEHHINELYDLVMNGKITDAKTQITILMVKGMIENGQLDNYLK